MDFHLPLLDIDIYCKLGNNFYRKPMHTTSIPISTTITTFPTNRFKFPRWGTGPRPLVTRTTFRQNGYSDPQT